MVLASCRGCLDSSPADQPLANDSERAGAAGASEPDQPPQGLLLRRSETDPEVAPTDETIQKLAIIAKKHFIQMSVDRRGCFVVQPLLYHPNKSIRQQLVVMLEDRSSLRYLLFSKSGCRVAQACPQTGGPALKDLNIHRSSTCSWDRWLTWLATKTAPTSCRS